MVVGGEFILGSGGLWSVMVGLFWWWWMVDGIFRVVVGDGEYFLGGSECWWVVVDGGG